VGVTGKAIEVLETMRSSFGSSLPNVVDPDSDECDNLYLVPLPSTSTSRACLRAQPTESGMHCVR
jgi:hypothetical protein